MDAVTEQQYREANITCPSCQDFIDQFCHPKQDCGLTPDDQDGMV